MSIICNYGTLLTMCSLTIVTSQDVQLTLTPRIAEAGENVEMHCAFPYTSSAFTVSIRDYKPDMLVWQYSRLVRTVSVGEAYSGRVRHTAQLSYSSVVTITLTNVTRDDEGWYQCVLEKTNQQALVGPGYLTVQASTSVSPTSGNSTQAPTTTSLSNMSSTATSAVPYSESTKVTKADLPVVDADSLILSHNSETVTMSWATPTGDYDKITIQQCQEGTDKCTGHDVTSGVNGLLLKVNPNVKYEFFMLLYRAGYAVAKAGPFVEQQEAQIQDPLASNTEQLPIRTSGNAGAIAGGVVGGLVFIVLIVAVIVLILKRRAILKSGKGTTSDVPVHVYENDRDLATAASQDDPQTSNEGQYEEIGKEAQSSRSSNIQHLYENQRHKEKLENESDYSGLGPREAPAPNVYDHLSAYEN